MTMAHIRRPTMPYLRLFFLRIPSTPMFGVDPPILAHADNRDALELATSKNSSRERSQKHLSLFQNPGKRRLVRSVDHFKTRF